MSDPDNFDNPKYRREHENGSNRPDENGQQKWSGLGPVHKALFEADDDEDVESDPFLDASLLEYEDSGEDTDEDEDEFDPFTMYQDEEDD